MPAPRPDTWGGRDLHAQAEFSKRVHGPSRADWCCMAFLNPPNETTASCRSQSPTRCAAQRRPESELRRHPASNPPDAIAECVAQRRPESELRRHAPARAWRTRDGGSLNEGRSLNSGDTRIRFRRLRMRPRSLNEGRSLNSGDTWARLLSWWHSESRSTKAGV